MSRKPAAQRGLTLVEVLVVVAIAGILLSLALPSFDSLIARKRVEGVASELTTDLQFARSEAVQRQTPVRLSASASGACYVVHTAPGSDACTCSGTTKPVCTGSAVALKSVDIADGATIATKAVVFEPVRGMSTNTAIGVTDFFQIGSLRGNWSLRSELTPLGRVRTCSPSGTMPGAPTCT